MDDEWKDPNLKPKKFDIDSFILNVEKLLCKEKDLLDLDYPTFNILNKLISENQEDKIVNCDRCKLDFTPAETIDEIDYNVCNFHFGNLISHQTKSSKIIFFFIIFFFKKKQMEKKEFIHVVYQ